jgi:hypothetical protein
MSTLSQYIKNNNSVSSTAWAIMAMDKLNPFTGERIEQPTEDWIPENNVTDIITEFSPSIKNIDTAISNAVQFIKSIFSDNQYFFTIYYTSSTFEQIPIQLKSACHVYFCLN